MRTIQHQNHWGNANRIIGRKGQPLPHGGIEWKLVAMCLADTDRERLPLRMGPEVIGGRLYLHHRGHTVLVRRLTGPHLEAAIRRLTRLYKTKRKNKSNDHKTYSAASQPGWQRDEFPTASANATEARA